MWSTFRQSLCRPVCLLLRQRLLHLLLWGEEQGGTSQDHHRSVSPSRVCDTPAVPFCTQQCGAEPRLRWRRTALLLRTHPSLGPAQRWSGSALHMVMWKCLQKRDRLSFSELFKMERPDRSKHDDKHKATWVTHCYVQITVTTSAWAADSSHEGKGLLLLCQSPPVLQDISRSCPHSETSWPKQLPWLRAEGRGERHPHAVQVPSRWRHA